MKHKLCIARLLSVLLLPSPDPPPVTSLFYVVGHCSTGRGDAWEYTPPALSPLLFAERSGFRHCSWSLGSSDSWGRGAGRWVGIFDGFQPLG